MLDQQTTPVQRERRDAITFSVEEFFYREARVLDDARYDEWLTMLTDDVRYIARQVEFSHRADQSLDSIGMHLFDEDRRSLVERIEWLRSGLNYSENPPTLKTRLVGNVRVVGEDSESVQVESTFLLHQSRWDGSSVMFTGRREDELVESGESWLLRRREVRLGVTVLPKSLTVFF